MTMNLQTNWEKLSYPRLCGLLAKSPTKLSQSMHNAGFIAAGLPFAYVAFDTIETQAALTSMRELGIRGFSLTIPHKEIVLPLLDELSPEAKEIKAVNTVINTGDKLVGENTDWVGIMSALKEAKFKASGQKVFIYGAGGAARAAIVALKKMGLTDIYIANRNESRAETLANEFSISSLGNGSITEALSDVDLIINSTPIGSHLVKEKEEVFPFSLSGITKKHTVFDMVTRETELIKQAKAAGATSIKGVRMLLFQAVEQFRLFTEKEPSVSAMEKALAVEISAGK